MQPAAARAATADEARAPGLRDQDETRIVPSEESGPFDDPHEARTRAYPLDEVDAATTVAAELGSEGDEEIVTQELAPETAQAMFGDPVTQQIDAADLEPAEERPARKAGIQDEELLELSATTSSGEYEAPAPAAVPRPSSPPSRPSSPPGRWSSPGRTGFEDDAVTNVLRSDAPIPMPMPARRSVPPPAAQQVEWPEQPQRWNAVVWGTALVVVAVVVGLVVRTFLAAPGTGMATVITKPVDARVSIDGRPIVDQTSPFSIQGLATEVDHEVVVEAEGHLTQRTSFRVGSGEVKLLPTIELEATKVETGFELASLPSGARVVVDGNELDEKTPVRVADLEPGRHRIRIEQEGFAAWETHLVLAEGQIVLLPKVTLMKVAEARPTAPPAPAAVAAAEPSPKQSTTRSSSSRRRRAARQRELAPAPVAAPAPVRATTEAAPAAGGGIGTVRVNSRPWSQVFIDGRLIGNTPQLNIALPAGQHRVDLVNPQLGMKKSFTVKVRAGSTTTKIVNLVE